MMDLERDAELGQVWTPETIASSMARELKKYISLDIESEKPKILDPASGPATFSKALNNELINKFHLTCYDIDKRFSDLTSKVNDFYNIDSCVFNYDYLLDENSMCSFDAAILNPPYIRHEKIKNKEKYLSFLEKIYGEKIDKRSNLFVYFLLKSIIDLKANGVACAIVYDAIKETMYGKKAFEIINRHAELISINNIKSPFEGALVDATIILLRKRGEVHYQNSIELKESDGLVPLSDLMDVKRGTSFIKRDIFIATKDDKYFHFSSPLFIKQNSIEGFIVKNDTFAYFLDGGDYPLEFISWMNQRSLDNGKPGYNLKNKKVTGPIVFNYYIRKNPRHLYNPNLINVADNFYTSIPKDDFPSEVSWLLLNSDLYIDRIMKEGRSQGSGLVKLQLFDYKNAKVPDWRNLSNDVILYIYNSARDLIESNANKNDVFLTANTIIRKYFNGFYPKTSSTIDNK